VRHLQARQPQRKTARFFRLTGFNVLIALSLHRQHNAAVGIPAQTHLVTPGGRPFTVAVFVLQLGADHLPAFQAHMVDRQIAEIGNMITSPTAKL
jgi:hypothetical protein